jgi:uncharacterized protein DUF7002
MGIDIQDIIRLRPYLFHLTDSRNVDRILRTRVLESASQIMSVAGREDLAAVKRPTHVKVSVGLDDIFLRDQAPLHAGNMKLPPAWEFDTFIRSLNMRVFFWPGSAAGPIDYGVRHFNRYQAERPTILRIRLASFLDANQGMELEVCRYNSGSPRWSRGVPAQRGASTFINPAHAAFSASQIVEITVAGNVKLPSDAEIGPQPSGPWVCP